MIELTYEQIDWNRSSKRIQHASDNFLKGFNCSQSVFSAFAPSFGLSEEFALKLSCSMGAGMGRMREVCGAVSAMALIVSLVNGNTDPENTDAKTENYRTVRMLADLFRRKRNTILCRELLGLEPGKSQPVPEERTRAYYESRPCPEKIADAAEILENFLRSRGML